MKQPRRKSKRGIKAGQARVRNLQKGARSKRNQYVTKKKQPRQTSPNVTSAIAKMREQGISLRKAARAAKVSPRTVIKNAASALRKKKSGRYGTRANDRLVRTLMIPTSQGSEEISIRGLRAASLLARYWVAVHRYYETGDVAGLQTFRGEFITSVDGARHPLLTDTEVLNRLGSAGVISFESLYARSA